VTSRLEADEISEPFEKIGERLRDERVRAELSQRELARRVGLSASMISQLESGLSKPSVGTLWAIVTELDVSLDQVIRGEEADTGDRRGPPQSNISPLVRPADRQAIELDSGVKWEQLVAVAERDVDFIHADYEVGGSSTPDESLMRHEGREYGYVISGTLSIKIDFEEYELQAGDSIAFDSTRPHRLFNKGDVPVKSIWFVVGRGADSRR